MWVVKKKDKGIAEAHAKMTMAFAQLYVDTFDARYGERDQEIECASGSCECETCGLEYCVHPAIGEGGIVVTCDGRFWKL